MLGLFGSRRITPHGRQSDAGYRNGLAASGRRVGRCAKWSLDRGDRIRDLSIFLIARRLRASLALNVGEKRTFKTSGARPARHGGGDDLS
jgi:hypothetical protein